MQARLRSAGQKGGTEKQGQTSQTYVLEKLKMSVSLGSGEPGEEFEAEHESVCLEHRAVLWMTLILNRNHQSLASLLLLGHTLPTPGPAFWSLGGLLKSPRRQGVGAGERAW